MPIPFRDRQSINYFLGDREVGKSQATRTPKFLESVRLPYIAKLGIKCQPPHTKTSKTTQPAFRTDLRILVTPNPRDKRTEMTRPNHTHREAISGPADSKKIMDEGDSTNACPHFPKGNAVFDIPSKRFKDEDSPT